MPTPARSARTQARAGGTGPQATARRRRPGRIRRIGLPYLLLLPALLFELLVHLVPMVVGVLVSFKALTQLYLAQWEHAPWAGLGNYRIVADFNGAAGQALLHSFVVTCAFTAIAVSLSCLFGCAAAILAQDQFRGRGVLWTRWLVLGALTIFALVPVFVMVSSSLKPLQDVTGTFRWIPVPVTFSPYIQMWQTVPLAHYFVNSLVVCTSAAALSVLLATFAAYAVSRYRFRGRRLFTLVVLSTQMFPGILFLLPLFLIFVSIGNAAGIALYGSLTGLVITYLTFSLPFSIWLLVGYFDSIPRALDEAALVDGCGPLRALFRVVIPAAIPGIVTVAIYAFMTAWSEVLFASVMTNDTTRTLAVGLRDYSTQTDVYWNQIMAASIVVSIPVVAGFLLMQRFLVAGITAGAVK